MIKENISGATEEEVKKYFHDKVNWVFYNKILYYITKYEDEAQTRCHICIDVPYLGDKFGQSIYQYTMGESKWESTMYSIDDVISDYLAEGISYEVTIMDFEKASDFKNNFKSDLIKKKRTIGTQTITYFLK